MRGSKCPRYIGTDVGFLKRYSQSLTKTKFIVGIRHPILWFQSFWRMIGGLSPYLRMELCPCPPDNIGNRVCKIKREQPLILDGWNRTQIEQEAVVYETPKGKACNSECTGGMLFCMMRGRFHVALAQLGKTLLGRAERQWLAPNDVDGGSALLSFNITNKIFLYEQSTLGEDSVWQELADFLGLVSGTSITILWWCHSYVSPRRYVLPLVGISPTYRMLAFKTRKDKVSIRISVCQRMTTFGVS